MAQKVHTRPLPLPNLRLVSVYPSPSSVVYRFDSVQLIPFSLSSGATTALKLTPSTKEFSIKCSEKRPGVLKTCKNCKSQFDPAVNHPRACRFHPAHFGGETKRKFESVYTGGTMDTPNSGQVFQYWHCCGSEDPFDPGCTSAPHTSYDDSL
ncbi:hypothetical protein Ancab_034830 [Ancistrocladus abbreviatus]